MGNGGTNDVVILMSLLVFLVGLGIISPLIQEATNQEVKKMNYNFNISSEDYTYPGAGIGWDNDDGWNIFENITRAIFWIFPWFPLWLTAIHIVLRVILVIIGWRLLRSGAG